MNNPTCPNCGAGNSKELDGVIVYSCGSGFEGDDVIAISEKCRKRRVKHLEHINNGLALVARELKKEVAAKDETITTLEHRTNLLTFAFLGASVFVLIAGILWGSR